jgi:hypothetical protein
MRVGVDRDWVTLEAMKGQALKRVSDFARICTYSLTYGLEERLGAIKHFGDSSTGVTLVFGSVRLQEACI